MPKTKAERRSLWAAALAKGETPTKDNTGYDITDGKYVWIAYKKITKDNVADAQ